MLNWVVGGGEKYHVGLVAEGLVSPPLDWPSSNLDPCSIFKSWYVNHEKVRYIRSARREG